MLTNYTVHSIIKSQQGGDTYDTKNKKAFSFFQQRQKAKSLQKTIMERYNENP